MLFKVTLDVDHGRMTLFPFVSLARDPAVAQYYLFTQKRM